ncbi:hypothetical protein [Sneathiella aquimaris]|uniref:hypothetical protein n=1 Tax=Sneathiella aquimaris TaxID=2599305 RepID=UPI00146A726D|nr:hypothetical protein [Sneathiella aquimaris]
MIKSLNILRTDEIVWDTIMGTLSDPSEIHNQLSEQFGIDNSYRKRRAAIHKRVHNLEEQLDTLDTSLADVETDYRMGKTPKRIYDRVSDNLNTERQSVLELLEQASICYKHQSNEDGWLLNLQSLVVDFDRLNAFNKRKKQKWLSQVVERIDVQHLPEDKEHVVSIGLKVPLFTDDDLGITVGERYRHRSNHSTVTDFARLRGWSTSVPFRTAT